MDQAQAERRGEQRFPLRLPVLVKTLHGSIQEETSLTRDVSARGAFFYVEGKLAEGAPIELVLTLPAEITLTESIRVRCKGKVVRVVEGIDRDKTGVAAMIQQYDFVTAAEPAMF
jgi:hypothetical protein